MKVKQLLILWIFLLSGTFVKAQVIRSFTPDSVVFIQELTTLFDHISIKENKEEAETILAHFNEYWVAESFSPIEKQKIYELANLMLDRRVKAYPHYMMFLQSLSNLKYYSFNDQNVAAWFLGMKQALQDIRSSKDFNALIEFSVSLMEKNQLYESRIFSWSVGDVPYNFVSDDDFKVIFRKTDLSCKTKNDSTTISGTSGTYYPIENRWIGQSGKITWKRAGLNEDQIYVTIDDYQLSTKSSSFAIDTVSFYNLNYFPGPIRGKLEEKVSPNLLDPDQALYPYFQSFATRLFIPGLFPDVDYEGSFAMKGAKIIGGGGEYSVATLTFKQPYKDKTGKYDLLVARSNTFIIEPDRINGSNTAIAIYHQDDSIIHSGLQFKYMNDKREISMLRIEKGITESPYFDTFHNVDIDCEAVYWKMDDQEIRFRSILGVQKSSEALFISDRYFKAQQYDILQGLDYTHPLIVIYNYARKNNTNQFFVYEMARYMKMPENQVESQIIRLAKYGFLYFDVDSKKAVIKNKLYHYIAAKNGRADYDVIAFSSKVENHDNATLSLDNFDLKISGVPFVSISDSQNVNIYPDNQEVILRKNRDFIFSGKIQAGLFEFTAKDCSFEYDSFRLNLPTIDFMKFKVKAFDDKEGEQNYVDVKTVVSNISGNLLIDFPSNKNGLRDFPKYPIFTSNSESYVYYDQDSTFKGAYARDRFYYNLQPFTLESLVNFSTDNLKFSGYLNSGGIFRPEVNKPLSVMPDYSLGFQVTSPAEGFPVYSNKGVFYDTVNLSMRGLRGTGTIQYLNTISKGRNIMFFLDSTNGVLDEFEIKAQKDPKPEFPSVTGTNLVQHWNPYQDSITLSTIDSAVVMFDNKVKTKGSLTYTPEQLTGSGKMEFYTATTFSNKYTYGNDFFRSDSLDLKISNFNTDEVAFASDKYKAFVDFSRNIGSFQAINKNSFIDLPKNRYTTTMDEFDWHVNENEIEMHSLAVNSKVDISKLTMAELINITPDGAKFTSLHALQDSLSFYAPEASFNLSSNILLAKEVKIIKVADAAIFPGDGMVEILEKASISPLNNAMIIADTANKNHLITDAVVNIQSRYSYLANGNYAYKNLIDEINTIAFDQIKVDSTYQTVASGEITAEQNFMFSPQYTYQGKVSLNAKNPLLNFAGAFKIMQDCDPGLSRWVKFEQRIKPDSLAFEVPAQPEEWAYKKLYAGFFHSNEENRVYPAFLSRKSYYSDTLMLSVDGVLTTRKSGTEFLISSPAETGNAEKDDPSGPFIKLNTKECQITALGKVNFGTDFGELNMEAFGQIDNYIIPDSTLFNVFVAFNFLFENSALEFMMQSLNMANTKGVEPSTPVTQIAYQQMLGTTRAKEVIYNLNTFGSIRKIPEELKKSIIISDVTLKYQPSSRSFISQGPIGVGMILGESVNKYFDGYLEIVRKRSGDIINLYLEVDRRHWYYFKYSNKVLQAISSENDFNKILSEVGAEKRKDKASDDETAYRFVISTTQAKNRFLRTVQALEPNEEE